jgi:hypothetical protein
MQERAGPGWFDPARVPDQKSDSETFFNLPDLHA